MSLLGGVRMQDSDRPGFYTQHQPQQKHAAKLKSIILDFHSSLPSLFSSAPIPNYGQSHSRMTLSPSPNSIHQASDGHYSPH